LRFGDKRVQALFTVPVVFSFQLRGFTNSEMRVLLAQLLGFDPANYPAGKLASTFDGFAPRHHRANTAKPSLPTHKGWTPHCSILFADLRPAAPTQTCRDHARRAAMPIRITRRNRPP
jgi:hypothetical protein